MSEILDPEKLTSASFSRSVFVSLGAAATAAGATIATALAQGEGLGKPHPPLVAENDPAIVVERPKLDRPGGPIDAYFAAPKGASAQTPGIVIVTHAWAVDSQIRDVARRFAKAGFSTIVPNYFARTGVPPGDNGATNFEAYRQAAAKLDNATVDGDIAAGAAFLRARSHASGTAHTPKIALNGFCMGGRIALRNASQPQYDAVASWYGPLPMEEDAIAQLAQSIRVPLVGSYGGRDTGIPPANVRYFQTKLTVPNDIKIYDEAGHAFNDDTRSSYVATAAGDAWTRTLAWFRRYLTP